MKKLLIILSLLFFPFVVEAASVTINGPSTIGENKNFTITLKLNDVAAWNVSVKSSGSVSGCSSAFADTTSNGKKQNKSFSIKCTAKSAGTITINVTGDVSYPNSNGTQNVTKKVSVTKKINVKVLDKNTNLKSLSVNSCKIAPTFNAGVTKYDCGTVDTDTIKINAVAESNTSKITGAGTKNLSLGLNTFNIIVTSESGDKKTYTIDITRKDNRNSDSSISTLKMEGYDLDFSSTTYEYNLKVPNEIETFKITATPNESTTQISNIDEQYLKVGENTLKVIATAENGTKTEYTFNITREERIKEPETKCAYLKEPTNNNTTTITIVGIIAAFIGAILGIIIGKTVKIQKVPETKTIELEEPKNEENNNF